MSDLTSHIRALAGPIIVTGATGFVGANLFHALRAVRSDVYAVVQKEKNWRLAEVSDANIVAANLTDPAAVRHLVDATAPKTVFDCVA